ncbi:MAG: hypothetical protein QF752_05675 [Planctomycetota bacterium]|nr:hypothetical protein [Planctomycetota bacterium]
MNDEDRLILLIEEGRSEEAVEEADRILAQYPEALDIHIVRIRGFLELCREDLALEALKALPPSQPISSYYRADLLYDLGRFEESERFCDEYLERLPDQAEGLFLKGLLLERHGEIRAADLMFQKAHRANPQVFGLPFRVGPERFEEIVDEALAVLPREFRRLMDGLSVQISSVVPEAMIGVQGEGLDPGCLATIDPDLGAGGTLHLFRVNIEHAFDSVESSVEIVRSLVMEEWADYLNLEPVEERSSDEKEFFEEEEIV